MNSIFVLGAGFSRPAGLPLGDDLFDEIKLKIGHYGAHDIINRDLDRFREYKERGEDNKIDFEEFISYLDIEHYLGLKGAQTWSCEGNKSQIAIRNLIALILNEKISSIDRQRYKLYEDFVDNLDPGDIIITFNYDNILEKCLERKNKPYRLFLNRLSSYENGTGFIDIENDEIVLLKMHGSIDWFDKKCYEEMCNSFKENGNPKKPEHPIFNNNGIIKPKRIINGPYPPDSVLNRIYRVDDIEKYVEIYDGTTCPLILSPSSYKMLYMDSLKELWWSFDSAGYLNKKVVIIGFSLPEHDEYIRQPLFNLITQFQKFDAGPQLKKSRLKMIDFRQTEDEVLNYKETYSFVDWDKTDCCFDGFNKETIDIIFNKD